MKRFLRATWWMGLAGSLAMFAWASVAHMATPLDDLGISALPGGAQAEQAVRAQLYAAIGPQHGLYMFPSKASMDAADSPQAKAELAQGPYGLLMYHPPGPRAAGLENVQIAWEYVLELVQCLIAAALLNAAGLRGFAARVLFVVGIGGAAVLSTNGAYWTFYGFPLDYTLGYAFTDLVRYLAAGLAMAALPVRVLPTGRTGPLGENGAHEHL